MHIKVISASLPSTSADALLVDLFEGTTTPPGATVSIDKSLNGAITDLLRANDFRGKLNEVTVIYSRGATPAPRVILIGLGMGRL